MTMASSGGLWVFGYGSLVWNPGFEFRRSLIGHVKGYDRRFWQGNETQRGTPEKPGRVATLIESRTGGFTWGRAFLLTESEAASSMAYLQHRETGLGSYVTTIIQFHPRDLKEPSFPVLVYVATERNPLYLGPADGPRLADEIANAKGDNGTNVEYVIRLAEFMREEVPGVYDEHLFDIEKRVKLRMADDRKRDVPSLEGDFQREPTPNKNIGEKRKSLDLEDINGNATQSTSGYSSQIAERKLKCVNIL